MNKETKTARIEFRITPTEKELFKAYAEKRGLSMSEAIMHLCQEAFKGVDDNANRS